METKTKAPDPVRVLLVDDDEVFIMSTTNRLMLNGLDVHAYTNPLDALTDSKQTMYDVALLDLKMPDMDGDELTRQLRQKDGALQTIIVTAHGSIDSASHSTRHGAYFYLNKPCETQELLSVIASAFAKRLKMKQPAKGARIENLLSDPRAYSPVELLSALEKLAAE